MRMYSIFSLLILFCCYGYSSIDESISSEWGICNKKDKMYGVHTSSTSSDVTLPSESISKICSAHMSSLYFVDDDVKELDPNSLPTTIDGVFQLFSHGRSGELLLDGEWKDAEAIVDWMKDNNPSVDFTHINIYGCHFAQGVKGRHAVSYIEEALKVTISASSNMTGRDGDWILELGPQNGAIALTDYAYNLQCMGGDTGPMGDCDGDGVINQDELDQDNDGILDSTELVFEMNGNATGTGAFVNEVAFFVWGSVFNDGVQVGDMETLTLADGSIVTATVTRAETADGSNQEDQYTPASSPTFNGAVLNGQYGSSNIVLYDNMSNPYDSVFFQFALTGVDPNNKPFVPSVFMVDGERTDAGESLKFGTNGYNWVIAEEIVPFSAVFMEMGVGTQNVCTTTDGGDTQGGNAYFSFLADTVDITTVSNFQGNGSGQQGFVIGILREVDTDNDCIADYIDLDSDGDGCFDAIEGVDNIVIADLDGDGQIDTTVFLNGVPVAVDSAMGQLDTIDRVIATRIMATDTTFNLKFRSPAVLDRSNSTADTTTTFLTTLGGGPDYDAGGDATSGLIYRWLDPSGMDVGINSPMLTIDPFTEADTGIYTLILMHAYHQCPEMIEVRLNGVECPELTVTKGSDLRLGTDMIATPGDSILYTFVIENTGNVTLDSIVLTDDRAMGIMCDSTSLNVDSMRVCTGFALLTQADIDAGEVVNSAIATGTSPFGTMVMDTSDTVNPGDPNQTEGGSDSTTTLIPERAELTLTKASELRLGTDMIATVGDSIVFTFTIENTGNVTLDPIVLTDDRAMDIMCDSSSLNVDSMRVCTGFALLTQADIDAGEFLNSAIATGTTPGGNAVMDVSDTANPMDPNETEGGADSTTTLIPERAELTLTKASELRLGTDMIATVGDSIVFTFTIENTGNVTLDPIVLTDDRAMDIMCDSSSLNVGSVGMCTGFALLTQADIDAGEFLNSAIATGTTPGGNAVMDVSDTANPMDPNETEGGADSTTTLIPERAELTLTKASELRLGTDMIATVGDSIVFTFTIENTGNVTLDPIVLTDDRAMDIMCDSSSLNVDSMRVCTGFALLTQADIDAGEFLNSAIATGTTPGGNAVMDVSDTANPMDPNETEGGADSTTTLIPERAELTLTKASELRLGTDMIATVGDSIVFTFTIENTGNVTLDPIVLTDDRAMDIMCDSSSLNVGNVGMCTGFALLTQADIDAGEFLNSAIATGTTPGGNAVMDVSDTANPMDPNETEGGADSTTTLIPERSELTLTKASELRLGTDMIATVGDSIVFTFTIENTGNVTLDPIVLTDDRAMDIMCDSSSLNVDSMRVCTGFALLTQADIDAGEFLNSAIATGTTPGGNAVMDVSDTANPMDPNETEGGSDSTTTLIPERAELTLTKASELRLGTDMIATVGDSIVFTFTIENTGNVTLDPIVLTDDRAMDIMCDSSSLNVDSMRVCTGFALLTQADIDAGEFLNSAIATGTTPGGNAVMDVSDTANPMDPNETEGGADSTTTLIPERAELTLTKASELRLGTDMIATVGDSILYTFVIENTGNVTLDPVVLTDDRALGIMCDSSSLNVGSITMCTGFSLLAQVDIDAGEFVNSAVATGASPGGTMVMDISDTANPMDPNDTDGDGDSTTTLIPEFPDLTVTKGSELRLGTDMTASVGDSILYTFTIENTGNVTLDPVVLADNRAMGIMCDNNSLAVGNMTMCTGFALLTQADIDAGEAVNSAIATGTSPSGTMVMDTSDTVNPMDPNETEGGADSTTTLIPERAELTLTKASELRLGTDMIATVGDSILFTFTIENTGNVTLDPVVLTDDRAMGIMCDGSSLNVGSVAMCTGFALLTQADIDAGEFVNSAIATGTTPGGNAVMDVSDTANPMDPNETEGDSDSTSTLIPQNPAIIVSKGSELRTGVDMIATVGDSILYTFVIENTGNVTLDPIVLTDNRAMGIMCDSSSLDVGSMTMCTGFALLTQADIDAGEFVNSAVATGLSPLGVPAMDTSDTVDPMDPRFTVDGDRDSTTTILDPVPGIDIVKFINRVEDTNMDGILGANDRVVYGFNVTNTGNVTLRDIVVTDPLASVMGNPLSSLAPGVVDNSTFTATYVIQQSDVIAEGVENTASVSGTPPNTRDGMPSAPVTDISDAGTEPTTNFDTPVVIADPNSIETPDINGNVDMNTGNDPTVLIITEMPRLELLKVSQLVEDTIVYMFDIINTGNVILSNIELVDTLTIALTCDSTNLNNLDVGEVIECQGLYVLTQEDFDAGFVLNTASVSGLSPMNTMTADTSDTRNPNDPSESDFDGDTDEDPTTTSLDQICTSMACTGRVNLVLDENCQGAVTKDLILRAGNNISERFFEIEVFDSQGLPHSTIFDQSDAGQTFTVSIINPLCNNIQCWGELRVENKNLPQTLTSTTSAMCGATNLEFEDLEDVIFRINNGCNLPVTNVIESIETSGDKCEGEISIRTISGSVDLENRIIKVLLRIDTILYTPLDTSMVVCPEGEDSAMPIILECADVDAYPDPEVIADLLGITYAYPYIDKGLDSTLVVTERDSIRETTREEKVELENGAWAIFDVITKDTITYLDSSYTFEPSYIAIKGGLTCNLSTKYVDESYPNCLGEGYKIKRTWSILDWCGSGLKECVQWITVVDTEAPIWQSATPDVSVNIAPWTCEASYELPVPDVYDACSDWEYTWQSEYGLIIDNTITGLRYEDSPVRVVGTAIDKCGNKSMGTFYIEVMDMTNPVAIALDQVNVSLTGEAAANDGVSKLYAENVNAGSHDSNCGEVELCVLLNEELENPIIRDGVYLTDGEGNQLYYPAQCEIDGIYEFKYFDGKIEKVEEIPYVICKDYVKFCCEDLGENKVALVVTDRGGKQNVSWSNVLVEDKTNAGWACFPENVDCDYITNFEPQNLPTYGGVLCEVYDIREIERAEEVECGVGYIQINYGAYLIGSEDLVSETTCIYPIVGGSNFNPYEIKWPKHYDGTTYEGVFRECEEEEIVEYGTDVSMGDTQYCESGGDTGEPVWCNTSCGLIGSTYEIDTVSASDACYKLIKRWTIIDWCTWKPNEDDGSNTPDDGNDSGETFQAVDDEWLVEYGLNSAYTDFRLGGSENLGLTGRNVTDLACEECEKPSGAVGHVYFRYTLAQIDGYYTYDQVIKIVDDVEPEVDVEDTEIIITEGNDAKVDEVTEETFEDCYASSDIEATAVDMCGEIDLVDVGASWWIERNTYNRSGDLMSNATKSASGNTATMNTGSGRAGWYAIITWRVEDGCGNIGFGESRHDFVDGKNPTPICFRDLSTAAMNTDGTVAIWAIDYDLGSFDNCSEVEVFFKDEDGNEVPSLTFTCDDIGTTELRMYVSDESGNEDFCFVNLRIDDNTGICPENDGASAMIAGHLRTEYGDAIEIAEVRLNNSSSSLTPIEGNYSFVNIGLNEDYQITSYKNDDHLNGVSSIDLVLLEKHILGLDFLDSPYKLIAADINSDERVSALDVLELRKLILGINSEFPENLSWRFIDADQVFANPQSPWPFVEQLDIFDLGNAQMGEDFIGVKIGDINGNVIANSAIISEGRTSRSTVFSITDRHVSKGERIAVPISAEAIDDIIAFQMTWELEGLRYAGLSSGQLEVSEDQVGVLDQGHLTMAWHSTSGLISTDESLFTLYFTAEKSIDLRDAIGISSDVTMAVAYDSELQARDVSLDISSSEMSELDFQLLQNNPNPFADLTKIGFILPETAEATLTIFDVTGKSIFLITDRYAAGRNEVNLTKEQLSTTGVLYYQLESGDYISTRKMVILE